MSDNIIAMPEPRSLDEEDASAKERKGLATLCSIVVPPSTQESSALKARAIPGIWSFLNAAILGVLIILKAAFLSCWSFAKVAFLGGWSIVKAVFFGGQSILKGAFLRTFSACNILLIFPLLFFLWISTQGDLNIIDVQPQFEIGTIGYVYGTPFVLPLNASLSQPLQPTDKAKGKKYDFGHGYYSKDVLAFFHTVLHVPVYQPLKQHDETLNSREILNDTCHKSARQSQKSPGVVVVLELDLGINPTAEGSTRFVRDVVTFLLGIIRDRKNRAITSTSEVIVRLRSNGGTFSGYGLLAEHFRRLRNEENVTLTICCDESALSGGYMIAAVASPGQLLASPFASIGSVGVITDEILNFREMLERFGVRSFQFHSGSAKAPISSFGDVREEQVDTIQRRLDSTHKTFSRHVETLRGHLMKDYDIISSGDYWDGTTALELGLVDRLITSDEYIDDKVRAGHRVVKISRRQKGWFWNAISGTDSILIEASAEKGQQLLLSVLEALAMLIVTVKNVVTTLT